MRTLAVICVVLGLLGLVVNNAFLRSDNENLREQIRALQKSPSPCEVGVVRIWRDGKIEECSQATTWEATP
jgi:hypothetical protein